jgi:hypothetical protein
MHVLAVTSLLVASIEVNLVHWWLSSSDTLDIGDEQVACPLNIPLHVSGDVWRKDDFGVGEKRVGGWKRLGICHVEGHRREPARSVQGRQQYFCKGIRLRWVPPH